MANLFSKQSKAYAMYRPKYPTELYEFMAAQCNKHDCAWDCATGNGQAAVGLSQFFQKVLATDLSENQIKDGERKSNIEYRVSNAEEPFTDFEVNSEKSTIVN